MSLLRVHRNDIIASERFYDLSNGINCLQINRLLLGFFKIFF